MFSLLLRLLFHFLVSLSSLIVLFFESYYSPIAPPRVSRKKVLGHCPCLVLVCQSAELDAPFLALGGRDIDGTEVID